MWPDLQQPIPVSERLFDWEAMTEQEVIEAYLRHGNQALTETLKKLGILRVIVYADSDTITDIDGARLWNFQGGYGSTPFGGDTDFIASEIWGDQIGPRNPDSPNRVNIIHAALTKPQGALLRLLAEVTPGEICRFQMYNSGTEAVDNLLQAVWYAKGPGTILTMENAYHGKSLGTRMATPSGDFMKGLEHLRLTSSSVFGGKKPLFVQVPYGDIEALEEAIRQHRPKAVLLEPVQGEAGGIRPPKGYLRSVEEACHKREVLVLYDEVQVGWGRVGKLWGCQLDEDADWQPNPDGISMAKALGGGYTAVAAIGLTEEFWQAAFGGQDKMLRTSTTFGGNANACIAGINSIRRIMSENLPQASAEAGDYLMQGLEPLRKKKHLIKRIGGAGLLVGIEFNVALPGQQAAQLVVMMILSEMQKRGVMPVVSLVRPVLRLEPPLTVSKEAIDAAVAALAGVLESYPSQAALLGAAAKAGFRVMT